LANAQGAKRNWNHSLIIVKSFSMVSGFAADRPTNPVSQLFNPNSEIERESARAENHEPFKKVPDPRTSFCIFGVA
jgi:hypothetical protein